ncbi:MAG: chemotaxis protein CheB [Acidobacteriota bacterium]|nr:chemotaxis protein CheB [Acidobacteriota bacterium]
MARPAAIVIGTSAGGVEALQVLMRGLPQDVTVPLFIVMHVSPEGSVLPEILARAGAHRAHHPRDGEKIEPGGIYVARPDFHMTVEDGHVRIVRGPRQNRHRPAIDPLFSSAAAAYGPGATGVILTGLLDDGTAGLNAIKRRGGTAIVQDPKDALYTGMPLSAIESVPVDYIVPLAAIPGLLVDLVGEGSQDQRMERKEQDRETVEFSEFPIDTIQKEPPGSPAPFSCPDCHGTLWEHKDENLVSLRCRTGHSFTTAYLIAGQAEAADRSLWKTLRSFEEQAGLFRHLAQGARDRGLNDDAVAHFLKSAEEKDKAAEVIRGLLLSNTAALEDEKQTS